MSEAVDRLVWVVARLREHCPWTRRLTHPVLTEYLIEEAYEAVEVIESRHDRAGQHVWGPEAVADGDYERLRREMGDVLFQVVLHAAIAEPVGGFSFDTVAEAITAKMIRRNPHVFHPDGTLRSGEELAAATEADIERNWERIKAEERARERAEGRDDETPVPNPRPATARTAAGPSAIGSPFASLPLQLPALAAAGKAVDRAARQPVDPLPEPGPPPSGMDPAVLEDEESLGEELFRLVQRARRVGLDPERALRRRLAQMRAAGAEPGA